VVIVGPSTNPQYGKLCRGYAPAGTLFLPDLSPELYASALKAARVFADLAWMPATPQHAVEAGLAGCALVLSDRLLEKEPFGADAAFCDPINVLAVRTAIGTAHARFAEDAPKRSRLQQRLATQCTWAQAVERTLAGYRTALAQPASRPANSVLPESANRRDARLNARPQASPSL
jgi:hypothetical protein